MPTTPKPPPADLPTHSFPTAADLEAFLETNHTTLPGFYLKLAKKSSGIPSVSSSEAVEVALCFGWIDGRANSLDEKHWTVRYTPRRAKSMWSAKNVGTIQRLLDEGRMRPAGLAAVESAKGDGRWDRAYDGPASIEVPPDLEAALERDKRAREFFEGLNKTDRYRVLHRLQTAPVSKREERVEAFVGMLARGEILNGSGNTKTTNIKVVKKGKGETTVVKDKLKKAEVARVPHVAVGGSTRQLRSRRSRK
ncbi:YdeI/OmpD-associated family protein [Aspergillus lucknowensis]|uniref:Bacteriocin-protection, YdeI or OmpD-associated-domain-containing protein n=1 Tax=Aspergillus lucknowensis TaxID=176173 RepID=A0ABR4M0S9_9EURO